METSQDPSTFRLSNDPDLMTVSQGSLLLEPTHGSSQKIWRLLERDACEHDADTLSVGSEAGTKIWVWI